MTTDRNQSSSDKYEKKHLNQSKANCELRSSLLRPRLPSVMAAAAAVSVLFGVGVTAAAVAVERRTEEPIPPWGNYCFWAELLCPFLQLQPKVWHFQRYSQIWSTEGQRRAAVYGYHSERRNIYGRVPAVSPASRFDPGIRSKLRGELYPKG